MKKHSPTQHIGDKAEKLAQVFLKKQGLKFIRSNFSCYYGELDLIMEDKKHLIFIEVRYRSGTLIKGYDSIDDFKKRRIINTASYYLQIHPTYKASRFDVVSVDSFQANIDIHWIKDAFQVE